MKNQDREKCIGENEALHAQLKLGWCVFHITEKTVQNGGFKQMFLSTFTHL